MNWKDRKAEKLIKRDSRARERIETKYLIREK